MHTPNETRPRKSQDQAAKEEVAEKPYHDDRMYVLAIAESTQFKFPYDFDKGETLVRDHLWQLALLSDHTN